MPAITIPQEYPYVLATISASSLVCYFHTSMTQTARKTAKVDFPNAYATAEDASKDAAKFAFNCSQRAHNNFLEAFPVFLCSMLVGGLKYPVVMSSLGSVWLVGRALYCWGYKTSQHNSTGQGRHKGAIAPIVQFPMALLSFYSAYQLVFGL